MYRKNVANRIPFRLYDPITGLGKTGLLPADVSGALARVVQEDGSIVTIPLVNGVNWFEIDSTNIPGLYHIVLTAASIDFAGPAQVAIQPSAAAFIGELVSTYVETIGADAEIGRKIATGKWQIHSSGGDANRLVLYDEDGTTPLYKFDLADVSGLPTFTSPFRRTPV